MGDMLYERLGGYNAIAAASDDLMSRLRRDPQLGRFWAHRGDDGLAREKQLLVDFLCASTGGPLYYRGRDMKRTHIGMRISNSDWTLFIGHLTATLEKFNVPERERQEVFAFVESTKAEIVGLDQGIGHFMLCEVDSAARAPTPRIPVLPQTSSAASD